MCEDWLQFNNKQLSQDTETRQRLVDLVRLAAFSYDCLLDQLRVDHSPSSSSSSSLSQMLHLNRSRIIDEIKMRRASDASGDDQRLIARLHTDGRVECAHRAFVSRDKTARQVGARVPGTCWHMRFGDPVRFNRVEVSANGGGEQTVSVHVSTTCIDGNEDGNGVQQAIHADWTQLESLGAGIFLSRAHNASIR